MSHDLAALSYVWILSLVVYITRRDSPFVRFHAKQGMLLFFLSIPAWFVPYAGKPLELMILGLGIYGFLGAAKGEWRDLPLLGPLTRADVRMIPRSFSAFFASMRLPSRTSRVAEAAPSSRASVMTSPGQRPPSPVPSQP